MLTCVGPLPLVVSQQSGHLCSSGHREAGKLKYLSNRVNRFGGVADNVLESVPRHIELVNKPMATQEEFSGPDHTLLLSDSVLRIAYGELHVPRSI